MWREVLSSVNTIRTQTRFWPAVRFHIWPLFLKTFRFKIVETLMCSLTISFLFFLYNSTRLHILLRPIKRIDRIKQIKVKVIDIEFISA